MKLFYRLITLVTLTFVVSGCAPRNPVPPPSLTLIEQKVVLGPHVKRYLKADNVGAAMTVSGDMLRVRLAGHSTSIMKKEIIYQFQFFDAAGFELPGTTSKWHRLRLTPKQEFTLQSVATSNRAVDYRITINSYSKKN